MTLTKLEIEAFKKDTYADSVGKMTVQFNPKSMKISWGNISDKGKQKTNSGKAQKLAGGKQKDVKTTDFPPSTADFNLVFDNTLSQVGKPVMAQVDKFKELCLQVEPDVHGTNYIILTWGEFIFKGQLSGLSVDYVLFMPDGTPLRAEVHCTFKGFQDALSKSRKEDTNSPDMTRIVTVKMGDTLPLLCYRHYGSNRHYLKVAKVNKMASASNLKAGQRIIFPPLEDDVAAAYKELRK